MITLYTFGPGFGLPDPSPFVMKTMVLLKMAGLSYSEVAVTPFKAPKRKLPYINDDDTIVADSTFIRFHIEKKYGFDFDAGLGPEQRAIAWAVEKMCEEHLYFAVVESRWRDDDNFAQGAARFFEAIPWALRPLIRPLIRAKVLKVLDAQGFGRHNPAEIAVLAGRDIDALATLLGDKSYLMGEGPCGADAIVFASLAGLLVPPFKTPLRARIESHANLVAYVNRMFAAYFPGARTPA